jgi:PAS domain S-box-containing protein
MTPAGGQGRRVLVVDDIAANRRVLRATLEAEGYAVFEAADGVEALAQLERHAPLQAVISDILMPNMDGYRLCSEIRKSERWRALPFIFYSSTYLSDSDEKLARELGGDKFIAKPASAAAMVAALDEAIHARRATTRPPTLPEELELMRQYSARLVAKLEEQNTELRRRAAKLEREAASRGEVEQALRESERRFNSMLDNVELVALMLDRDARVTYCNDFLLRLTGWRREDVIGQDAIEMLLPPDGDDIRKLFAALLNNEPVAWHPVTPILTRLGERRVIQWNNTVLRSAEGQVIGTASIGADITERLESEARAAAATRRMQALAHRLVEAQESEQRRLSAELHDRIGQNLTALGINLNIVAGALAAQVPPETAQRLRDSLTLLEGTTGAVRQLVGELRPPELKDYGLLATLRTFSLAVGQRSGLAIEVTGEEPSPRFDLSVDTSLYRIAQEALNNVVKHARAHHVAVRLMTHGPRIVLTIEDDGAGFEPDSVGPSHWGLDIMRERAEAAGAKLHVESAAGAGTRVIVELERPE